MEKSEQLKACASAQLDYYVLATVGPRPLQIHYVCFLHIHFLNDSVTPKERQQSVGLASCLTLSGDDGTHWQSLHIAVYSSLLSNSYFGSLICFSTVVCFTDMLGCR